MKENRDKVIAFIIKEECNPGEEMTGSYHCAEGDKGGCTKFGIANFYHPDAVLSKRFGHGLQDLTRDEAEQIYQSEYWDIVRGDSLPPGVDLVVTDLAVTSSPHRSVSIWEGVERFYGKMTFSIAVQEFTSARKNFYRHIVWHDPKQQKFLNDWLKRAARAQAAAIKLIDEWGNK